jgi:hypothetical protein
VTSGNTFLLFSYEMFCKIWKKNQEYVKLSNPEIEAEEGQNLLSKEVPNHQDCKRKKGAS